MVYYVIVACPTHGAQLQDTMGCCCLGLSHGRRICYRGITLSGKFPNKSIYIYIYIYIYMLNKVLPYFVLLPSASFLCMVIGHVTVSFHNFKSQNFKLSVSNPKSKYVGYVSVLSQISNCQGLGRKNKHVILKTDRIQHVLLNMLCHVASWSSASAYYMFCCCCLCSSHAPGKLSWHILL